MRGPERRLRGENLLDGDAQGLSVHEGGYVFQIRARRGEAEFDQAQTTRLRLRAERGAVRAGTAYVHEHTAGSQHLQ